MKGYLLIALSATGFGLMPIFATFAYGDGLGVSTLLFLRFAIAAALFLPYVWWRGVRLSGRERLRVLLMGAVLYALQSALYFSAVQHISPALAALLLYLYPGMVATASAVLSRQRPSKMVVLSVVVSFCGVALALGRIDWGLSLVGVAEALGAAVVYTVYILYGDRVGGSVPPVAISGFVSLFAAMTFLVFGTATGQLGFDFAPAGWIPVLCVAVVSTVVAILCFFRGMAMIGPTRASIGSMLEPVVSIGATALLLAGSLTWLQGVGAVLVLVGATVGVLSRRDAAAEELAPVSS